MLAELLGILLELDFACNLLPVLARPIDLAGLLVFNLDEIFLCLCHNQESIP